MTKPKNHLERMADRYLDMAKKATTKETRDECLKRANMLKTMNSMRMIGESDAEYHNRSKKNIDFEEKGDMIGEALEHIKRELGR